MCQQIVFWPGQQTLLMICDIAPSASATPDPPPYPQPSLHCTQTSHARAFFLPRLQSQAPTSMHQLTTHSQTNICPVWSLQRREHGGSAHKHDLAEGSQHLIFHCVHKVSGPAQRLVLRTKATLGACWTQARPCCLTKKRISTCFPQGLQYTHTPNVASVCRLFFTMAMTVMYNGIQFAPVSTKRSIVVPFPAEVVWSVVGKFGRQAVWMGSVEGQRIFTQLLVGY